MDKFVINGGNQLKGEVKISGAKNSALPILCAAILTDAPCLVENVPALRDIRTIEKLLTSLGCKWHGENNSATVYASSLEIMEAPYELVKTMRASVLVLGPLVGRFGFARLSLPGGCAIGARPINLHLEGLKKMGASVSLKGGYVEVTSKRLNGARIYFDIPTVTGTENLMMAACLADGTTILENAALEPEIVDLAEVLIKMGARIEGHGSETIVIHGVRKLGGFKHKVIPDRIEAGTYIIAALITRGAVTVSNVKPDHLSSLLFKLREAGAAVKVYDDAISVSIDGKTRGVDVKTLTYPGFPTDMQAQYMALMAVSEGVSVISETIFENRFMHVSELCRMGAHIKTEGSRAIVTGVDTYSGAPVMATDLRASASLVIAGLCARGQTTISRVYHIDRGYEKIEEKMGALGADITRVST